MGLNGKNSAFPTRRKTEAGSNRLKAASPFSGDAFEVLKTAVRGTVPGGLNPSSSVLIRHLPKTDGKPEPANQRLCRNCAGSRSWLESALLGNSHHGHEKSASYSTNRSSTKRLKKQLNLSKPLPDCDEIVVAEPDWSVAMAYRDQINKLAFKIAAV